MLNDRKMRDSARGPGVPVLRIVPVERREAGPERRALVGGPHPRRGVPRSAEEWTALAKVGSGERDVPDAICRRLIALGLVLTVSGVPALTRHGRYTLGLPD